jgi:hypothetical protein
MDEIDSQTEHKPEGDETTTNCDHCGIAGCCSPLDCLKETMLKNPDCGHSEEYYSDLAVAWFFSRWVLYNAKELIPNLKNLEQFNSALEQFCARKGHLETLENLQRKWFYELKDNQLISYKKHFSDQNWFD